MVAASQCRSNVHGATAVASISTRLACSNFICNTDSSMTASLVKVDAPTMHPGNPETMPCKRPDQPLDQVGPNLIWDTTPDVAGCGVQSRTLSDECLRRLANSSFALGIDTAASNFCLSAPTRFQERLRGIVLQRMRARPAPINWVRFVSAGRMPAELASFCKPCWTWARRFRYQGGPRQLSGRARPEPGS